MNEIIKDWVVYLTIYSGDLMPRRYIGSTYQENIDLGYNGTVSSTKYKKIWLSERKNNPHLFKTRVLERGYPSQKAVQTREGEIQRAYDVVKSDIYLNMAEANGKFFCDQTGLKHTAETKAKMSASRKGKKHPNYDPTIHTIVKFESILLTKVLYMTTQEILAAFPEMDSGTLSWLLSRKKHTYLGWMLPATAMNPPANVKIHTIENQEHDEDSGTLQQLLAKHPEMSESGLRKMLSRKRQTCQGWSLKKK
jgi:hypothetical protein